MLCCFAFLLCCVALSLFISIFVVELSCKSLSGLTSSVVISCIHVHVQLLVKYVYLDVPAYKIVAGFLEKNWSMFN